MVINAVGHLAEAAWHHPDLRASYVRSLPQQLQEPRSARHVLDDREAI